MEVKQNVCPESTIESAVQRNPTPRKVVPSLSNSNDKSTSKGESKLACESTIDSSFRRDFIKKAALLGAAAAVGTTLLGSKIIPESSATSCTKSSSVHPESHVVYCCPTGTAIEGHTCSGIGVIGCASKNGIGVGGHSSCFYGVEGSSSKSIGVWGHSFGQSSCSIGVAGGGCRCSPKSIGVAGASACSIGVEGLSIKSVGVYGNSCCSYGVLGYSPYSVGVFGESCCSVGVEGCSIRSVGVFGESCCSYGVEGYSSKSVGVVGSSSGAGGIGVEAFADNSGAIPFVARGASCQSANLQQWRNSACTPLSVVNKCGWFGIGTSSPATTLQVKGSIGAKVVTPSCSTYCVADNCFAVLVNATSAAKTVNLPKAIQGMILYIKNTGTDYAVTIKPKSGDTIEGATSKSLPKEYGLTLIAGGNSPATWYIISYIK